MITPKSKLDWIYGSYRFPHDDNNRQTSVLPHPDGDAMKHRFLFRRSIQEATLNQRRIHNHGGMRDTGRNICFVLRDRECRGGSRLTPSQKRPIFEETEDMDGVTVSRETDFNLSALQLNEAKSLEQQRLQQQQPQEQEEPQQQQQQPQQEQHQEQEQVESTSSMIPTAEDGAVASSEIDPKGLLRRVSYPMRIEKEMRTFGEYQSVTRYHSAYFNHLGGEDTFAAQENAQNGDGSPSRPVNPSSKAVSTISIAFSPDSKTMASTHGDHTVKITCCATGNLLETLKGHPRTPWTVKYHPTDPNILASGCLGHQVRIWNWKTDQQKCINIVRLESAIISLSFHPGGKILAIANGQNIHFWGFGITRVPGVSQPDPRRRYRNGRAPSSSTTNGDAAPQNSQTPRGVMTKTDQGHMLRCVHFLPTGRTLIVGGVNPRDEEIPQLGRNGMSGGGMSFYLRLWDFDAELALNPSINPHHGGPRRRTISNPRTFVPRVLLYNDGGFDVSPDGKVLCACAEYWLPNGINNAMELLQLEEQECVSVDGNSSDPDEAEELMEALQESNGLTRTNPRRRAPSRSALSPTNSLKSAMRTSTSSAADAGTTSGSGRTRTASQAPLTPRTPPPGRSRLTLSPPSPPGRRFTGGLGQRLAEGRGGNRRERHADGSTSSNQSSNNPVPPPSASTNSTGSRPPHPLSIISGPQNGSHTAIPNGRYVPHVVTISLDTTPVMQVEGSLAPGRGKLSAVARGYRPRLGQLLEACPLDGTKATAVTCVKFSPSTDFCLIGYGIREPVADGNGSHHPVTALYRIRGGMTHISTMLSEDDDVNIARFHPDSGYGFVYGTKQGRVRVLSPRPWNYYDLK